MGVEDWVSWTGVAVVLGTTWLTWVSWREGEDLAVRRTLLLGFAFLIWVLGADLLPGAAGFALRAGLLALAALVLLLLLPVPGRETLQLGPPVPGVDERDIMFSRAELVPGTERFETYYRSRPGSRARDDLFRVEAGLLSPDASQHHPLGFPAAEASFWTIERLRPFVEGTGPETGTATEGEPSSGSGLEAVGHLGPVRDYDTEGVTRFLKAWALKLGAHSAGVTQIRDYHLYTHVGRGAEYGEPVRLDHPFALALTVEMDRDLVDPAPRVSTVMESARQYLRSGTIAVQLADLIRRLGYRARAHVDGNYRVICPLVAKDAGLGEIGRMGLLMTPRLGPRVRIAVVTTDLPLIPDTTLLDPATLDFCLRCRKCAAGCPSGALPFGDPEEDGNGVLRWRIDADACFTLWTKLGTDCARCMAVCPYSHPDNLLHNAVRWGIRNNAAFRRVAIRMDDFLYGSRPRPKPLPEWIGGFESRVGDSRIGSGGAK
jgi:ferredoxin